MAFLCCSAGELVKTFELSAEEVQLRCTTGSLSAEVTCARYNHNGEGVHGSEVCAAATIADRIPTFAAGKILASCSIDGGICLDVAASGELLSRFFAPTKSGCQQVRSCCCQLHR